MTSFVGARLACHPCKAFPAQRGEPQERFPHRRRYQDAEKMQRCQWSMEDATGSANDDVWIDLNEMNWIKLNNAYFLDERCRCRCQGVAMTGCLPGRFHAAEAGVAGAEAKESLHPLHPNILCLSSSSLSLSSIPSSFLYPFPKKGLKAVNDVNSFFHRSTLYPVKREMFV